MGNLPPSRVQQARPFLNCGVDFCGPVYTHFKIRGKRPQKSYIAVFCCFATKAIHLEVVSDLSTDGFLGALKRFISRRGKCENIYCDNGRNFVGAKNKLDEVQQMLQNDYAKNRISNMCLNNKIQFHFIPPRSPHFGGLWEAAVKSTKYLLHRTTATAALTYEELCTTTTEIEAILNSRPLIPLSSDPSDLTALTPAHFLIGEPMTSSIDTHPADTKMSLLSRWQLVNYLKNEFWKRWHQEYLTELQKRAKWMNEYPNIKEGTVVIVKEDNIPPMKWPLGIIVETISGPDGKIRVADVKTATGIYRRAVQLLAPLPVELDDNGDTSDQLEEISDDEQEPPQEENVARHCRKRKARRNTFSTAKVFLLTALMLPFMLLAAPVNRDEIHIQNLDNKAGIYFEKIGKSSITSSNWNLLVYYDLTGYFATVDTIEQILAQLVRLTKFINHNDYYTEIIHQYQHQLHEIKNTNILLEDHTNLALKSRIKRSPLNIIGTVANKLFGILDEEYAEKMATALENVKSNENHLLELLKNQTSVVETTVNIVKKGEEERINQIKRVEQNLELIYDKMRNMNTESKQQKAVQAFNTLSILIASLINEFHYMQNAILDVVIDTHHGRANPLIITISQLKEQLTIIKEHLPPGFQLPQINGELSASLLYKLMTIQCKSRNNFVIFSIKLPLVSSTEFEIFRIIPFPTLFNHSFVSISTKMNFIMVNLYKDQFYLLTEMEYSQCLKTSNDHHICEQHRPIYYRTTSIYNCEIELFMQNSMPPSCAVKVSSPAKTWIQLSSPNYWLFSLDKQYRVTIICENIFTQKTLNRNGIISLPNGCILKENDLIINALTGVETEISIQSFTPTINITLNVLNQTDDIASILTQLTYVNHTKEFNSIKTELDHIKNQQDKLKEIQPHDVHQFTLGYMSMCVAVVIAAYLIIRHLCKKKRVLNIPVNIPQAAPRIKSTPRKEDYNFEVIDFNGGQDVQD